MAKEFEGSATGGQFSPNKTLRLGDNSKENEARFASTLSDYGRIVAQNDQTYIDNARKQVRGWEDLAKFSKTLTKKLVEDKQRQNQEDYDAGLAEAYANGIPEAEARKFDEEEAAVNAVGEETDALGAEYSELSGSEAEGDRISRSSGWRALGRATGIAKQGAAAYPMFLAQNADALSSASTPEEYAAVIKGIRTEYLRQYGGMNRALMGKYMFPSMQEVETSSFLSWQKSNNEIVRSDRADEMGSGFYAAVQTGQGGPAFVQFLQQNKAFYKGKGKARAALFQLIERGIASGKISLSDVNNLRGYTFDFNGKEVTLGKQFAPDFDDLQRKHDERNNYEFTQRNNERTKRREEIIDNLLEKQKELGRNFNREELDEIHEMWKAQGAALGQMPNEIKNWDTYEEVGQDAIKERIEAKIRSGVGISEADLEGLDSNQRQQYSNFVKGSNSGAKQDINAYSKAVALGLSEYDGTPGKETTEYLNYLTNVKNKLTEIYYNNIRDGMEPTPALNEAKRQVDGLKEAGAFSNQLPTTDAAQVKQHNATAFAAMDKDPSIAQTQIIPGTMTALTKLQNDLKSYREGGSPPEIPQIYKNLAAGIKGWSPWDLANQQLILSGSEPLEKPPSEQMIDTIPDAEIRQLFTYKPTPARAMRAGTVIEYITGDRSHTGYAADHGGSNYHEHIAFDSKETRDAAIELLESNNIFVGSRNDGKHAEKSYHYSNQAFDVPLYPNLERFGLPDNRDGEEQFSGMVRDLLSKNGFGGAGIRASNNQPVPRAAKQFLDFVASPESNGDYNAFNLGGSNSGHTPTGSGYTGDGAARWGKELSEMTVGEVMELGSSPSSEGRWVHAAGRYQIIPKTLRGLVRNHNIDTNALFDEEMQDQLALKLAYARLVQGNKITGLRNEWVSLQNIPAGQIQASLGQAFNNPELLLEGV